MKTTIDIPDALLFDAKKLAKQHNVTLRSLVEQGLRLVIDHYSARRHFTLKKASFKGKGLQDEFAGADWRKLREAAYENHGA